ncbi:MAG: sigma-70 family RNA polymerase sigma factor, partial [Candidatus Omnitrophota bacterium]
LDYAWSGMPLLDLINEGYLGLAKAIERYKPQTGYRFSTYAIPCIKQAISKAIYDKKEQIRLPRSQIEKLNNLKKACRKAGLDPNDKKVNSLEIAKKTGLDIDLVNKLRNIMYTMQSFDQPYNEDSGGFAPQDAIADDRVSYNLDEKYEIFLSIAQETSRQLAKNTREGLDKKLAILKFRIFPILLKEKHMTFKDLGELFKVSRQRIQQTEEDVIATFKGAIKRLELSQEDLYLSTAIQGLWDRVKSAIDFTATTDITLNHKNTEAVQAAA